ncbi:SRPBCC family protein [Cryptosporangium sp. NPDC051539]|uniref:SRPBCC family protein n=1 Tax=Cryptosporangium sp. NPDC051539 TaxID=3363962 RepID=UPI0037BD1B5E
MNSSQWPAGFDPETAPVYARNEIRTPVPAERLWPALVTATAWPTWYPHAAEVVILDGGDELTAGSRFTWTTLNVQVHTQVTEFEPARRLAWSGKARGAGGYHRWILTPEAGGGCHVLTEEVQTGLVPRLAARRLRRVLHTNHQEWLENLVERQTRS